MRSARRGGTADPERHGEARRSAVDASPVLRGRPGRVGRQQHGQHDERELLGPLNYHREAWDRHHEKLSDTEQDRLRPLAFPSGHRAIVTFYG